MKPLSEEITELKAEVIKRIINAEHIKTKLETSVCLERELINPIIDKFEEAVEELKISFGKGAHKYFTPRSINKHIDEIFGSFNQSQVSQEDTSNLCANCGRDKLVHTRWNFDKVICKKFQPETRRGE